MKRMTIRFFALVLLVASSGIIQVLAQNLPVNDPRNEEFLRHFVQIRSLNPTVKDFNKMDVGYVYGLPNNETDHLEMGDANGIWGREFRKFYGISYEEFLRGRNPAPADPTTSGPAFIAGGIRPEETDRLRSHFDGFPNLTRISPVESGTITGEGEVSYSNGTTQRHTITTPMPAYQARYRRPDGTEEVIQTLQRCMNPVLSGGTTYRGFTFTSNSVAVQVPPVPEESLSELFQKLPWWLQGMSVFGGIFVLLIVAGIIAAIVGSQSKGKSDKDITPGLGLISQPAKEEKASVSSSNTTLTPAIMMREEKKSVPTTEIVPKKAPVAPFSQEQKLQPSSTEEKKTEEAPAPQKAKTVEPPTQQFVSFTSSDENGPSKVSWSKGVDVHSLHIEPNGVKTIRFSEKK